MANNSVYSGNLDDITTPSVLSFGSSATNVPFTYGILITFPKVGAYQAQISLNLSSGKQFASRIIGLQWNLYD